MDLTINQKLHGFTVLTSEELPEIDGTAFALSHDQSGAKLLYLKNDDVNKAFSIAFRTLPADDTGVFHILEHSVLCGSDKFPVKEPFVNLLKSSMQTFLNAMTFPDKTVYPVASTNDQDLLNLTDVYLDAVLRPMIYRKRAIFEQEGWHYELSVDGEDPTVGSTANTGNPPRLTLNGVVYNEMKGALSDPNSVLYDELQAALFPDTAYRFESGGTPRAIPDLTYERFLEEHARHYRLDNSYITLYGDLDLAGMLAFLDGNYLGPLAASEHPAENPREFALQKPVEKLGISKTMVTAPENACMGLGYIVGEARDHTRMVATDILLDVLMGSNEAPLKRALLDAKLSDDIQAFLADSLLQPFAVIQLKGLRTNAAERFRSTVERALSTILDEGIDPTLVEASLSRAEFVMREHEFGMADGVALAITGLSGWLYGDDLATTYLRYEDTFAFLRESIADGYFEDLARSVFLENDHRAEVEIRPIDNDEETYEESRLKAVEATLDSSDLTHIAEKEAELRRLQTEPDSPEALATLPTLGVAEIADAPPEPEYGLVADTSVPCLRHQIPSRGISFVYRYFDLSRLSFEDLPYASILGLVLGKLATASHTASELDTLINGRLGNLSFFTEIYEDDRDPLAFMPKFVVSSSALSENVDALSDIPNEVMFTSDFTDTDKIRDILQQRRIGMEQRFSAAGHSSAMMRVASYYLPAGVLREQLGNVDFYRFVKDLLTNYDDRSAALSERLADIARRLFTDDGLTVSFTGPDADFSRFLMSGGGAVDRTETSASTLVVPKPLVRNEAFIVPTDVCYAAQGFDRRAAGTPYSGTWQVAARALSYDYLWNEVRVKGGAYGAGFQAARTGAMRFYSYRDPHLDETLARFAGTPSWLESFSPAQDEMEGYIVSTVAGFDTPLKARALTRRQDSDFFGKRTRESRLTTRDEMMATDVAGLRALAPTLAETLRRQAICVFGNRDILENASTALEKVDLLND